MFNCRKIVFLLAFFIVLGVSAMPVDAKTIASFKWRTKSLEGTSNIIVDTLYETNFRGKANWFVVYGEGCEKIGDRLFTRNRGVCTIAVRFASSKKHKSFVAQRQFAIKPPKSSGQDLCVSAGVCKVGDLGPGGGRVFFVSPTPFASKAPCGTSCRYLEIAPVTWFEGLVTNCRIYDGYEGRGRAPLCKWSQDVQSSVGTEDGIGAGFANTSAMRALGAGLDDAAGLTFSYRGGGLRDWYLGSSAEMSELCKYSQGIQTGDLSVKCPRSGESSWMYAVDDLYYGYWTSMEINRVFGGIYSFDGSGLVQKAKSTEASVRPIRAF
jgi:hypothetical protein